jgi:hypothetical protein
MSIFKRGNVYWYHFLFNGEHIQKSTKQGNPRTARQIEAAYRTALAKGEVGLLIGRRFLRLRRQWQTSYPGLSANTKPTLATHRRYATSSVALLRHFKDVALDKITPDEVERFKTARLSQCRTVRGKDKRKTTDKKIQPATVNRELACLRAMFNHEIKADVPLRNPIGKTAAKGIA